MQAHVCHEMKVDKSYSSDIRSKFEQIDPAMTQILILAIVIRTSVRARDKYALHIRESTTPFIDADGDI